MERHCILLYLLCMAAGVAGQPTITRFPQNEAQYVDGDVNLICEFQESVYELVWSECVTTPYCSALFRDGASLPGASVPSHYSAVNRTGSSGKRYDLVITGVQTADGGQFRCDNTFISSPAYDEVIVLGSDMDCSDNLTSGSEVELGTFIHLNSEVSFHGRWPPVVRFKYPDNTVLTGLVGETSGNTAKYSVVLEAVKSLQGQALSAEWYFDYVTGTAAGEATNPPTFPAPNTCTFQPITVFYPPESLNFCPYQNSYHVGETITCTGEGNPAPSLQWISVQDASVTVDCNPGDPCQLVVTDDMADVTVTYQCRGCNTYYSMERCDVRDITFRAYKPVTPPTTTVWTSQLDTSKRTELSVTAIDPTSSQSDVTSNNCFLSAGGLAGLIVVCVLLVPGNVFLVISYWRKHGAPGQKEGLPSSVPSSPLYQNMATYVNGGGPGIGDGEVPQSLEIGSDPYEELGTRHEPARFVEYDTLRPTRTEPDDINR